MTTGQAPPRSPHLLFQIVQYAVCFFADPAFELALFLAELMKLVRNTHRRHEGETLGRRRLSRRLDFVDLFSNVRSQFADVLGLCVCPDRKTSSCNRHFHRAAHAPDDTGQVHRFKRLRTPESTARS